jgi:hypothetical protein
MRNPVTGIERTARQIAPRRTKRKPILLVDLRLSTSRPRQRSTRIALTGFNNALTIFLMKKAMADNSEPLEKMRQGRRACKSWPEPSSRTLRFRTGGPRRHKGLATELGSESRGDAMRHRSPEWTAEEQRAQENLLESIRNHGNTKSAMTATTMSREPGALFAS